MIAQWVTCTWAGQFEQVDPIVARLTRLFLSRRVRERGIRSPAVLSYPDKIIVTAAVNTPDPVVATTVVETAIYEVLDRYGYDRPSLASTVQELADLTR